MEILGCIALIILGFALGNTFQIYIREDLNKQRIILRRFKSNVNKKIKKKQSKQMIEFKKYATQHLGMSSMHLDKYMQTSVPNIN